MTTTQSSRLSLEQLANQAATQIKQRTRVDHRVALVAGSGWGAATSQLGVTHDECPMTDLPGFSAPTVDGHAGLISSVQVGPNRVLVFRGRRHRYEFPVDDYVCMDAIVHSVVTAYSAGCRDIILTNAVGGLNPNYTIGQAVLIADQNGAITAAPSPLRGGPTENFLNCNQVYDPALLQLAQQVERLDRGVYAQIRGPQFETPHEIRFLRLNGIDLIGMSIIQEALMAHRLGMRVLGISLVTDRPGDDVSHHEVQRVVHQRAPYLGKLLQQIVERI